MFCLFSPSKCVELLQICGEEKSEVILDDKVALNDQTINEETVNEAINGESIDDNSLDKLVIDGESNNRQVINEAISRQSIDNNDLDNVVIEWEAKNEQVINEETINEAISRESTNNSLYELANGESLNINDLAINEKSTNEVTSGEAINNLVIVEEVINEKANNKKDLNEEVINRNVIGREIDKVLHEEVKEKLIENLPETIPAKPPKMHSSESAPAAPATGPNLLLQLGKLIIRARSSSPAASRAPATPAPRSSKLLPSTSQQVILVPPADQSGDEEAALEEELAARVSALWDHMEPVCIEVSLCAECHECSPVYERARRALLLERWTMQAIPYNKEPPALINSQWLLNAVRSQLHFSQLSAWLARLHQPPQPRRKLSREQNYKKLEPNTESERKLNIVYSMTTPGNTTEFAKPPVDHTFPCTDVGNHAYLKVTLESLPRLDDIPPLKCQCQSQCQSQKRRPSKDHTDELVGKLNDLSIGSRKYDGAINSNIGTPTRRLSIISNPGSTEYLFTAVDKDLVDDRMHTPCSESGKHKCNCDDESDGNKEKQPPKKLDERRLKEIAKYKRRIRKEKMKKLCDSTSSEGDGLKSKETTSIPILQAARFDRLRAIGCYRNQTYLTLPASRIETKSPFVEPEFSPPDLKKTNTIGTQTDDIVCQCGSNIDFKCVNCHRGMVRSDGNYNLASISDENQIGGRRKLDVEDDEKSLKKHKCDNSIKCDNDSVNINIDGLIKRPKLRRVLPIVDRLERIVCDRMWSEENGTQDLQTQDRNMKHESRFDMFKRDLQKQDRDLKNESRFDMFKQDSNHNKQDRFNEKLKKDTERDIQDLHLNTDDSVFSVPKDSKRQKTYSISDDGYILYEKCDYGTIDRNDIESPKEESPDFKFAVPETEDGQKGMKRDSIEALKDGFVFPDPKKGHDNVPSPSEMDKFRWRLDSAASMVFHTRTGLPLTSSPAPLRRGNNCFDFDDSINGISGIKSALFHPIPPCSPVAPASPVSPPTPRPPRRERNRLKMGPSAGLLGSFEESALQGRLEAVATVHGFTAELGASGAFCPPHVRLPVTVFFYAPGGTNAPYMGHINLGPQGYRVARSGTIQVSLFNPHGTLVKMFVVLYELGSMPSGARTFLRQRTLYMPPGAEPAPADRHKYMRYLIHLRFMTSKSGKLYLHTDIRLIVSRKADLDTATAHSALFRPIPTKNDQNNDQSTDDTSKSTNRAPNRVFGGSSEHDTERHEMRELGYENQNGVSYELRSFTYAPENPKYSPR